MKQLALTALLFAGLFNTVFAETVALKANHPEKYVVKKGDSLWKISALFLQDPWQWPEIWHVNPAIDDPHLIYPGDVVWLKMVDGKPRLVVNHDSGDVRLSPKLHSVDNDGTVNTIPWDKIKPFLTRNFLVSEAEYESSPYVVAPADGRLLSARHDQLYARGIADHDLEHYTVIRKQKKFVDPNTGELIGYEAEYLGEARISQSGDPAIMRVTESDDAIDVGDRLVPTPPSWNQDFKQHFPKQAINATVVASLEGLRYMAKYDVLVLDAGKEQGLDNGTLLRVHRHLGVVKDKIADEEVLLPDLPTATVMIINSFDKLSYALVMDSKRSIRVGDKASNP